jgi:hypothetical protein
MVLVQCLILGRLRIVFFLWAHLPGLGSSPCCIIFFMQVSVGIDERLKGVGICNSQITDRRIIFRLSSAPEESVGKGYKDFTA